MEVHDLLKRAQDMLIEKDEVPASPPRIMTKVKPATDVDDWVDINEADDESDSGWTTPSCTSSQSGSPRCQAPPAAAPAPVCSKSASTVIAAPAVKGKDEFMGTGDEAAAVAPKSPPQVSEVPSPAQSEKQQAMAAAAAAAGFSKADLQDLKAMMITMKGDIGRCTQVAEHVLASQAQPAVAPGTCGRGAPFAWRLGPQPALGLSPAPATAPMPLAAPPRRAYTPDLSDALEVTVDLAQEGCKDGYIIHLKPKQGGGGVRLFVGEFEGSSLVRAVSNKLKTQHGRPMTYDFMKSSMDEMGIKVAAVVVSAFVNNTFHALVHYEGRDLGVAPAAVDARPSDAINLALRMGAPVYVAKKVLSR